MGMARCSCERRSERSRAACGPASAFPQSFSTAEVQKRFYLLLGLATTDSALFRELEHRLGLPEARSPLSNAPRQLLGLELVELATTGSSNTDVGLRDPHPRYPREGCDLTRL